MTTASVGLRGGAGIGAALGGVGGLVLGLTALAVPGVGPVIAAGPLAAALVGAGVGAAAGGLIGALIDIGIPEDHAYYYGEGMRRGGVLVTVATTDETAERAESILSRHNPIDLSSRVEEWRRSGWSRFDLEADQPPGPWAKMEQNTPTARPVAGKDVQGNKGAAERAVGVYTVVHKKHSAVEPESAPPAAAVRGFETYDAGFRRHFTTTFAPQPGATYDMYMLAYRYGYTLATDTQYSSRDWTMLEPEAQRNWERDHPGTWERFKAAIRYAWDEVRGRR